MAKAVAKTALVPAKFGNELKAEKRMVVGRKVKRLRREGFLPANIYGRHVKSSAIQVKMAEFGKVFTEAGETGLVGLKVDSVVHPVLIHNLQRDPVTDEPLHADFLEVNLAEKIAASVPIEIVGDSPIVASEEGVLVQQMHEVEVEALPTELPEKVIVDISGLTEVDATIKVSDLKVPGDVEIKDDPERIVVNVAPPAKEEVAPPPEEVPAEGEEGAPPAEGDAAEGEAPASAEAPAGKPAEKETETDKGKEE